MSVTFYHTNSDTTLILRNPSLGDSEKYDIKIKSNVAMDNTMYSHKQTPIKEILLLAFTYLTKAKIDEMVAFFEASAGSLVRYTDQSAKVWYGYTKSNINEFIVNGNLCAASKEVGEITFEFEVGIEPPERAKLYNSDRDLVSTGGTQVYVAA